MEDSTVAARRLKHRLSKGCKLNKVKANPSRASEKPVLKSSRKRRGNFIEGTLTTLVRKTERALFAEELARKKGFLQNLDPRVKIIGLLALILDVTLARNFFTIIFIFAVGIGLAVLSGVPLRTLAARAWLGALTFTGAIAVPVIFITPGDVIWRLPLK